MGPDVGYEAVGLIDSSLTTVSVWAKNATASPATAQLDPSDPRLQSLGQSTIRSAIDDSDKESTEEPPTNTEITPASPYEKGVVFYLKDQKLVGVLMFNLFNRSNLARSLLKEGFTVDNINQAVRLMNIHDTP